MRGRPHERLGDLLAGNAPAAPQGVLGTLDRVERAQLPDDHLVRPLVEPPAAILTLRHTRIVRLDPKLVVSQWFRWSGIFGW
jgi:hypothetical protein